MELRRIAAIDDQEAGRTSMRTWIENHYGDSVEPVLLEQGPATVDSVAGWVKENGIDAVLIDHHLRKGGYGQVPGLVIAAHLSDAGIPTILTSSYDRATIKEYVWYKRRAPAFLSKGNFVSLPEAMAVAVAHIRGDEQDDSKPYRTVVRIDSVEDDDVGLVIPAFSNQLCIMVSRQQLESRVNVNVAPDARFMADVNIGALSLDEVFLDNPGT